MTPIDYPTAIAISVGFITAGAVISKAIATWISSRTDRVPKHTHKCEWHQENITRLESRVEGIESRQHEIVRIFMEFLEKRIK